MEDSALLLAFIMGRSLFAYAHLVGCEAVFHSLATERS